MPTKIVEFGVLSYAGQVLTKHPAEGRKVPAEGRKHATPREAPTQAAYTDAR